MPVTFIALGTAVAALLAALEGWRQARIGAERAEALGAALADALESSLQAEAGQEQLRDQMDELRCQLDRLTLKYARQQRRDGDGGFRAAIELSRDGADDEVLMESCGLTRGEARLIRNIYRPDTAEQAH